MFILEAISSFIWPLISISIRSYDAVFVPLTILIVIIVVVTLYVVDIVVIAAFLLLLEHVLLGLDKFTLRDGMVAIDGTNRVIIGSVRITVRIKYPSRFVQSSVIVLPFIIFT